MNGLYGIAQVVLHRPNIRDQLAGAVAAELIQLHAEFTAGQQFQMAFNLTNRRHQIIDQITVAQEQHDNADNQGSQQHILVDGDVCL